MKQGLVAVKHKLLSLMLGGVVVLSALPLTASAQTGVPLSTRVSVSTASSDSDCNTTAGSSQVSVSWADPGFNVSNISVLLDDYPVPSNAVQINWPTATLLQGLSPGKNIMDVYLYGSQGEVASQRTVAWVGANSPNPNYVWISCPNYTSYYDPADAQLAQPQWNYQDIDDGPVAVDNAPTPVYYDPIPPAYLFVGCVNCYRSPYWHPASGYRYFSGSIHYDPRWHDRDHWNDNGGRHEKTDFVSDSHQPASPGNDRYAVSSANNNHELRTSSSENNSQNFNPVKNGVPRGSGVTDAESHNEFPSAGYGERSPDNYRSLNDRNGSGQENHPAYASTPQQNYGRDERGVMPNTGISRVPSSAPLRNTEIQSQPTFVQPRMQSMPIERYNPPTVQQPPQRTTPVQQQQPRPNIPQNQTPRPSLGHLEPK